MRAGGPQASQRFVLLTQAHIINSGLRVIGGEFQLNHLGRVNDTSAHQEQEVNTGKSATTTIKHVNSDLLPNQENVVSSEPPSKPPEQKISFLTEEQWRKDLYTKAFTQCEACRARLLHRLKKSRESQQWKQLEEAAKIEKGRQVVEELELECAKGICGRIERMPDSHRVRRTAKPKFERRDLNEEELELNPVTSVTVLSVPFEEAGKWFVKSINAWHTEKKAKQAKTKRLGRPIGAIPTPTQGTLTAHPLPPSVELLEGDNANLVALSEQGRLEYASILEKAIKKHAKPSAGQYLPASKLNLIRLIALRVECLIYRTSMSPMTYLRKVDLVPESLQCLKAGLTYSITNGKLMLYYNRVLYQTLAEPLLPKRTATEIDLMGNGS